MISRLKIKSKNNVISFAFSLIALLYQFPSSLAVDIKKASADQEPRSIELKLQNDLAQTPDTFQKGVLEYNQKNFKKALVLFLQARKERPKDPNVLFYLGNCYFSLQQKDFGLEPYWTLISNFPNLPKSKQAIAYLKQIAPDFLQKHQQELAANLPADKPANQQEQKPKGNAQEYTANDVMVILKATGERRDCSIQLISSLKEAFNKFPIRTKIFARIVRLQNIHYSQHHRS